MKLLFREYEFFDMKASEIISQMCKRFSNLINELKGLENKFKIIKLIKKVLRSLLET